MSYTPEQIAGELETAKFIEYPSNVKTLAAIIEQQRAELDAVRCGPKETFESDHGETYSTRQLVEFLREFAGGAATHRKSELLESARRLEAMHASYIAVCPHEIEVEQQRDRIAALEARLEEGMRATNFCFPEDLDAYGSAHDAFYEAQRLIRTTLKPRNEENPT
jgi:hypothetical protein